VTEVLVPKPWKIVRPSEAVLYRYIDKEEPTVLLDECDALFGQKDTQHLRAILDDGFERGGGVPRCVGPKYAIQKFRLYCPKVLAGIGTLPDTLESRKIPINLKRKTRAETVKRFRKKNIKTETDEIRAGFAGWAKIHTDELVDVTPELPESLTDRQQDIWEPLLAIADLAGGDWPQSARTAAVSLHDSDSAESLNQLLIAHIREAFGDRDTISTTALLGALIDNDAGPWGSWWESEFNRTNTKGPAAKLAYRLRDFGIKSKKLRDGSTTHMGYERAMFEDAWERYLPER